MKMNLFKTAAALSVCALMALSGCASSEAGNNGENTENEQENTEYRKHGIYTSDFDSVIYGNPELYGFICQLISLDSAAEEEQRKKETEKKEKKEKISK